MQQLMTWLPGNVRQLEHPLSAPHLGTSEHIAQFEMPEAVVGVCQFLCSVRHTLATRRASRS